MARRTGPSGAIAPGHDREVAERRYDEVEPR
jgi:hypothetical protein